MTNFSQSGFPILFDSKWPKRDLANTIGLIDQVALCREYRALVACAPRRHDRCKKYFVGHCGITSSGKSTNRREEHYAVALFNLKKKWSCPNGSQFRLLDYQVPLKARQADVGLGKIDLLGLTDAGRLMVIELKVKPDGGDGETPTSALMEGLRYAAVVEANLAEIQMEVKMQYSLTVSKKAPIIQLLAPSDWWRGWRNLPRNIGGNWSAAFVQLVRGVEKGLGITVECVELDNRARLTPGLDGKPPQLNPVPALRLVPF